MRYHWSLGIGHTYSHNPSTAASSSESPGPSTAHDSTASTSNSMDVDGNHDGNTTVDNHDEGPEFNDDEETGIEPQAGLYDPSLTIMEDRENEDLGGESDDGEGQFYAFGNAHEDDDDLFEAYYM